MPDDAEIIRQLREDMVAARETISHLEQQAHLRNLQLDAMHWVWCSGGCKTGVHRWTGLAPLTEEVVDAAEANVKRMRKWLENYQYRQAREAEKNRANAK